MNRDEIKEKLIEILKKHTRDMEVWETADESSSIIGHLKITSARFVDVIISIEDDFEVYIDDETMNRIHTIKQSIDLIKMLVDEK